MSLAAEAALLRLGARVYAQGDKLHNGRDGKHAYEHMYAEHLGPLRHEPIKFLEIGLGCNMHNGVGLSVPIWRNYLRKAELWWAEFNAKCVKKHAAAITRAGIAGVLTGDQGDVNTLKRWMNESRGRFDFIIDDGGHQPYQQWITLSTLWPHLNPGGKLVIEDMGEDRNPSLTVGGPLPTPSLMHAVWELLAGLVEWGNPTIVRNLVKHKAPRSPLYDARTLPDLKSIQCYAEACVFIKCHGRELRCP